MLYLSIAPLMIAQTGANKNQHQDLYQRETITINS